MNTGTINCTNCQTPLVISAIKRRNHTHTCVCKACGLFYQVRLDGAPQFVSMQKRFSHNETVWHFVYSFDSNSSKFIRVRRRKKAQIEAELLKPLQPREEHILPGLVKPERFLGLISFL